MKKILLLFSALSFSLLVVGQERVITGKVTAKEDGSTLPGVNVLLKGSTVGTVTDADGKYSLSIPSSGTALLYSFIGYVSQEIILGERSNIDVEIVSDVTQLSEIVVTGFSSEQKRDISGSIGSVKGTVIENMPVQSFDRALQGRIAGVQVTSNNGLPGGAVTIRVRGSGSINAGNDPLYIVDGVQMKSGDNTGSLQSSNALAGINPNDIESIDVLKDASAASIYGAQASNGVVIITTKRGKSGQTKFSFNSSIGLMERINKLDVLNRDQFVGLSLESVQNAGFIAGTPTYDNLKATFDARSTGSDWQDAIYRKGLIQNYEISAQGGNDKTTFFISANYNDTKSHIIATDFKRTTFRVNLDNQITSKLKISTTLNLSYLSQAQPPGGGAFANPIRSAHLTAPVNTIYDDTQQYNLSLFGTYSFNLLWIADKNYTRGNTFSSVSNLALEYEIIKGLKWKSRVGIDYQDIREDQFWDPRHADGLSQGGGYVSASSRRVLNPQTDHTLTYNNQFAGNHSVSAIAGFQYRSENFDTFFADGNNLPSYKVSSIGSAATAVSPPTGNSSGWKLLGYFAKAGYIYKDKYIFNATIRRDGSSRFGADTRYGNFPAVSAAWRISAENFMSRLSFIDDMKIRASYGKTGNTSGISNFASRGTFSTGGDYNGAGGLVPNRIANPNLTWEENLTTDFGLDFALFQGRVTGTADYYIRDTNGLLLDRPIPLSTGFLNPTTGTASITQNIGQIRNTGLELSLGGAVLVKGDFRWDANVNITFQSSKVMKLTAESDTLIIGNAGETYIVGQKTNGFFLQEWAGVNPADGRPMWYDEKGNLTFNRASGTTRKYQGSLNPDYFGGFRNTFNYKGLSLETFFQFQAGNLTYNADRAFTDRSGSTIDRNQRVSQLDRWQNPGQITSVPQSVRNYAYANGASNPTGQSTRFMEKGDYIRLKQITLSYTVPSSLVAKMGISSAKVFAQGINLWTKTEYTGYDPEIVNSTLSTGDMGITPQAKSYVFGLQLTF